MYSPYMVAHRPVAYSRPQATKEEVLDVVFGVDSWDGIGRTYDDIMGDTALMCWPERISCDSDAERELMALIGKYRDQVPAVMAIFDDLAADAAKK